MVESYSTQLSQPAAPIRLMVVYAHSLVSVSSLDADSKSNIEHAAKTLISAAILLSCPVLPYCESYAIQQTKEIKK